MKRYFSWCALFVLMAARAFGADTTVNNDISMNDTIVQLPIGGNTYAINTASERGAVTNNGIENWADKEAQFETYLRVNKPGTVRLAVHARTDKESKLQVELFGEKKIVTIKGTAWQRYEAGEWVVKDSGYLKIILCGVFKSGKRFADMSQYEVSGTAINAQTAYVKNNEGNFFYWGRRGPSVHLKFPFDDAVKAVWFYNEATVPAGQDLVGSYFMAVGFAEGYFGIQVNSAHERRILFSVWSPYATDDPKSIPEDQRIGLLKKGDGVNTGEFGNEGAGGQSFLRYNWKAGTTYRFLVKGKPDGANHTDFTAYFFVPEKDQWMLIASFRRPRTNNYLKGFHSFLENFRPEQGNKERHVLFGNQWIGDEKGRWQELTEARFTYDNTALKGYRMDYAGGTRNDQFYLRNCGFFSDYTPYGSTLIRPRKNRQPEIDLSKLP